MSCSRARSKSCRSIVLGLWLSGITIRLTRSMMLEVLRQDHIRTAWSKGLAERVVVLRHALKNALIPVVTMVGLQLPVLVGGAVVVEYIFNLPGLGSLMVRALEQRDYPIVSGINLLVAAVVLVGNLIRESDSWQPRKRLFLNLRFPVPLPAGPGAGRDSVPS